MKCKYIVCDEDGPIRVFYSKEEAQKFLQKGWTIKVEKVATINVGKTLSMLGEAPF
jgi:hypothetical protein